MSGLRIAHLINPVKVDESRDLYWQQPIVFDSMVIAKRFTEIDVQFYTVMYEEDSEWVKFILNDWCHLPYLGRSTEGKFRVNRKLPYFKDMLDRLYEASDADYFIQTNADICLQPYFYELVKDLIEGGNDAFCITKRILPEEIKDAPLSVLYSTMGGKHAGHDCFVFRRELYPELMLGDICMGTPWSETTLITSLVAYAKNFTAFNNAHATFHIGDRRVWLGHEYNDYRIHNTEEFVRVLNILKEEKPHVMEHPVIKIQLKKLYSELHGYKNETYSKECWSLVAAN